MHSVIHAEHRIATAGGKIKPVAAAQPAVPVQQAAPVKPAVPVQQAAPVKPVAEVRTLN
jgi:hypothetical protein